MKIYTKKGDDGDTHLATGRRVAKNHPRVELYGNADELNSQIGVAIAHMPGDPYANLRQELREQQSLLFELGSELAGFRGAAQKAGRPPAPAADAHDPGGYAPKTPTLLRGADIEHLEQAMDRMSESIEPMRSFILPGGSPSSAQLQVCRTVCRRLERLCVQARGGELQNRDEHGPIVADLALQYINRLSDYLFVAARYANHLAGMDDIKWGPRAR
jgi:cob(I)alamin adenosyltransferase